MRVLTEAALSLCLWTPWMPLLLVGSWGWAAPPESPQSQSLCLVFWFSPQFLTQAPAAGSEEPEAVAGDGSPVGAMQPAAVLQQPGTAFPERASICESTRVQHLGVLRLEQGSEAYTHAQAGSVLCFLSIQNFIFSTFSLPAQSLSAALTPPAFISS